MAAGKPLSLQVIVLATLFLGGGAFGVGLAQWLAPGSVAAQFVGLFTFSLPFAISMQFWVGSALVVAVWRTLTRGPKKAGHHEQAEIPGGSIVFIPTCTALVTVAGLLVALFGSSIGVIGTAGLYLVLGAIYGTYCWLFARAGYLPFPNQS